MEFIAKKRLNVLAAQMLVGRPFPNKKCIVEGPLEAQNYVAFQERVYYVPKDDFMPSSRVIGLAKKRFTGFVFDPSKAKQITTTFNLLVGRYEPIPLLDSLFSMFQPPVERRFVRTDIPPLYERSRDTFNNLQDIVLRYCRDLYGQDTPSTLLERLPGSKRDVKKEARCIDALRSVRDVWKTHDEFNLGLSFYLASIWKSGRVKSFVETLIFLCCLRIELDPGKLPKMNLFFNVPWFTLPPEMIKRRAYVISGGQALVHSGDYETFIRTNVKGRIAKFPAQKLKKFFEFLPPDPLPGGISGDRTSFCSVFVPLHFEDPRFISMLPLCVAGILRHVLRKNYLKFENGRHFFIGFLKALGKRTEEISALLNGMKTTIPITQVVAKQKACIPSCSKIKDNKLVGGCLCPYIKPNVCVPDIEDMTHVKCPFTLKSPAGFIYQRIKEFTAG